MRRSVPNWLISSGCARALRVLEEERRPARADGAVDDLGHLEVRVDLGGDADELALALEERDPVAQVGGRRHRGQSRALALPQRPVRSRANGPRRAELESVRAKSGAKSRSTRSPLLPRRARRCSMSVFHDAVDLPERCAARSSLSAATSTEAETDETVGDVLLPPIRRRRRAPLRNALAPGRTGPPRVPHNRDHTSSWQSECPTVLLRDRQRLFEHRSSVL